MGDNRRQLRLEKELREVISRYLVSQMRGELEGLVSVSRIQAAPDLKSAKVFVSILGTPAQADASLETMQERARDIQDEVHHLLKLRFTPRLTFQLDTSLERQLKVEGILRNLEMERTTKTPPAPGSDSASEDEE